MTTDSGDKNAMICYNNNQNQNQNRRNNSKVQTPGAPPPEQEQLPCPRCHSTNTKFCYYNNYNFSQPRHFCKSCRRYWTHGGTLRDIPVGGGTRKSAKRSRPTTAAVPITSVSSTTADAAETKNMMMNAVSAAQHGHSIPIPSTPIYLPLTQSGSVFCGGGEGKVGTFTSLLDTQGPGFLALGGFGLGIGAGYEEVGFGISRGGGSGGGGGWPFSAVSEGGAGNGGPTSGMGHTWQFENGESGYVNGDCCSAAWPDLAISTPGNGLK